jgi:two-component system NtrC family sensor kinase
VSIEDSGPGVPPALRTRIFDPFFTTKPAGHGTGLGLSISAQIAARHGGTLTVEDAKGGGARFVLRLPLTSPPSTAPVAV